MAHPTTLSPAQREAYEQLGFLVIRGAFPQAQIDALVDAIERLMDRALRGELEIGWLSKSKRLPGRVSGLLHPLKFDMTFAQWQDDGVADLVEAVLQASARHSLFGMLAGGGGKAYEQGWHRDLAQPGSETEQALLDWFGTRCTQINAPLKPHDKFLQVVPGSHRRPSTPEEIEQAGKGSRARMPGETTVHLEPGDIALYNPNLWHRGWNPQGKLRWTIHSAYWRAGIPVMKHEYDQREAFTGLLERYPPKTRALIERYLADYPEGEPLATTEMAFSGQV